MACGCDLWTFSGCDHALMRCVMQGLATFIATGEIPAAHVRSLADSVFTTIDTGLVPR